LNCLSPELSYVLVNPAVVLQPYEYLEKVELSDIYVDLALDFWPYEYLKIILVDLAVVLES
jgi:hypothetical protein